MTDIEASDVAIIGAGPIGMEVAIACRQAGLSTLQFDAGQIGQIIAGFPPHMRFFSSPERIGIAGLPVQTADQSKCTREEYLAYLRSVVGYFDLDIRTYENVISIERRTGGGFEIESEKSGELRPARAKAIVLATGGTARPRRLDMPGEDLPHVSHHLGDPHQFFRTNVVIVGGRNAAVEAAIRCFRVGAHVTLVHRGDDIHDRVKYWLTPEVKYLVRTGQMNAHFNTVIERIAPGNVLAHDRLRDEHFGIDADFVLLMIGYEADMSLFEAAGVALEGPERAPQFNPQTMETNVPGLYVAGTATAGTQYRFAVYLENCHAHAQRIVAALKGEPAPHEGPHPEQALPES